MWACSLLPPCCRKTTLVDAGLLEPAHVLGDLLGRADATGARRYRQQVARLLVFGPDIGAAGGVLPEDVVMAKRVAEEAEAVETAAARFLRVGVAREASHHCDIGVHGMAERHAVVRLDDIVIFGHPLGGLVLIDESERECTEAMVRRLVDSLAARAR